MVKLNFALPPYILIAFGIVECKHHRLYSQPDCDSGWDSASYQNVRYLLFNTAKIKVTALATVVT